jgi:hypothetical protein
MKWFGVKHSSFFSTMLPIVLITGIISACNPQSDLTPTASEILPTLFTFTSMSTATIAPSPTITSTLPPTATATQTNTPIPSSTPTSVCLRILNPPDAIEYPELGEVKFEWEPVAGAVKYRLEMVTPMNTTVVFETFLTNVNRYLVMYPWGGIYTWKLTAIGAGNSPICVAGPFNFTKLAYAPTVKPGAIKIFRRPSENCG